MNSKTRSILLAAVLATPVAMFASPNHASAQYRVDNGGATDANNRIGSGGYNDPRPGAGGVIINGTTDMATGNTTAGRELRINSPFSAPGAFHGTTAGTTSDRFVRQTASAYDNNAQVVKPFYGGSYGVPPPPAGFVTNPTVPGTYIQAPAPIRSDGDLRQGDVFQNVASTTLLPQPGEFTLPGQVDGGNANSLLTASPIFGIRQDDSSTLSDGSSFLSRYNNFNQNTINGKQADDKTIQNMRDELRKNIVSDNPNDNSANPLSDPNNLSDSARLGKPFESPETTSLSGAALNSPLAGSALNGKITSDQTTTNQLVPAPAQSDQYKELDRRMKSLKNTNPTDQQVNAQFQQDYQKRQAAELAAKNGTPGSAGRNQQKPGAAPGGLRLPVIGLPATGGGGDTTPDKSPTPDNTTPPASDTTKQPEAPATPSPAPAPQAKTDDNADKGPSINTDNGMVKPGAPLVITSLTTGMKPSGLRDTLGNAEDLMRQGKYTSALDQYDLAERVAPNNPMVTIGRAHAELGASYYARAEQDIRRGLGADSALMLGQYKLDQFLGRDRMDFLEKDLKDITTTEPKSVRAPFLLAYIKYNAGDLKMASNYLALSEKREGSQDDLYKQLRIYWNLPAADPIPDGGELNK